MSLSRNILSLPDTEQRAAILTLARKTIAEGGGRRRFDQIMRPILKTIYSSGHKPEDCQSYRRWTRMLYHEALIEARSPRQGQMQTASAPQTRY
jgi:hypothetical protein